jgi:hypothetical protein
MIEASQRMMSKHPRRARRGMSPSLKRHLKLEIKALENAPRDADKLEHLLQKTKSNGRCYAHRRHLKASY